MPRPRDDPLCRGARGEAGGPSEGGEEPRARPSRHGEPPRAAAGVRLGCDLAAADKYGRTILHDTASYFEGVLALPRILAELKGAGIDVNAADGEGATALLLMVKTVLPYVTGRNIVGLKEKLPVKDALQVLDALLEAGPTRAFPARTKKRGALARELKAPRAFLERLAGC